MFKPMLNGVVPPLLIAGTAAVLLWCRQLYVRRAAQPWRADLAVGLAIVCVTALLEISMGRTLTYKHGPIRPWVSEVTSDQNSQQISDWYTFSHIIHGALFYGATHLVMGPAPLALRAAVTAAIEATWESYENTDTVIDRYRAATIARGYYGDSVLNSIGDVSAAAIGCALAAWLPVWPLVAGIVFLEAALALWIRDNLTLNILMLLRPVEAIRRWQMGG